MLGHTNVEIAALLFLSPRTVETHRASIQRKLGVKSRADLVRFALGKGGPVETARAEDGRASEMKAAVEDDLRTERLDRLLAGAGHQLRTPLNSVLGFTEILLMGLPGPLNEEQRRQLHNVRSGARLLETTIDNLLDLDADRIGHAECAARAGRRGDRRERGLLDHPAHREGESLTLDVDIPAGMTWCTNRRAFSRILMNLASNALAFTDSGGVQSTWVSWATVWSRRGWTSWTPGSVCVKRSGIGCSNRSNVGRLAARAVVEAPASDST